MSSTSFQPSEPNATRISSFDHSLELLKRIRMRPLSTLLNGRNDFYESYKIVKFGAIFQNP